MENKSPFRSNSEFNIFDSGEDDEDTIEYTDKKKKKKKSFVSETWQKLFPKKESDQNDAEDEKRFLSSFGNFFNKLVGIDEQTKENEKSHRQAEQNIGKSIRSLFSGFDVSPHDNTAENKPTLPDDKLEGVTGSSGVDSLRGLGDLGVDIEEVDEAGGVSGPSSETPRHENALVGSNSDLANEVLDSARGFDDFDEASESVISSGSDTESSLPADSPEDRSREYTNNENNTNLGDQSVDYYQREMYNSGEPSLVNQGETATNDALTNSRESENQSRINDQQSTERLGVVMAERLSKSRDKKLQAEADKIKKQVKQIEKREKQRERDLEDAKRSTMASSDTRVPERGYGRVHDKHNVTNQASATRPAHSMPTSSRANTPSLRKDLDRVSTAVNQQAGEFSKEVKGSFYKNNHSERQSQATPIGSKANKSNDVDRYKSSGNNQNYKQYGEDYDWSNSRKKNTLNEKVYDIQHEIKEVRAQNIGSNNSRAGLLGNVASQQDISQLQNSGSNVKNKVTDHGKSVSMPAVLLSNPENKRAIKQGAMAGIMMLVSLGFIALIWSLMN